MSSDLEPGEVVGAPAFFGRYSLQLFTWPLGVCRWNDEEVCVAIRWRFWRLVSRVFENVYPGEPLPTGAVWRARWEDIELARVSSKGVTFVQRDGGCCRLSTLRRSEFEELRSVILARVPTRIVHTTTLDPLIVGTERTS